MFFPRSSSRHRPSVVSRCRHCLSSVIVCIFRPCRVHLLDGGSFSRAHHCKQQWFASNQFVGGRLGNHNAAPHCCKESDPADSLRLLSSRHLPSLLLCTVQYSQDFVTDTFVGSFSYLFSLLTAVIGSDIQGIMSMNSSSFQYTPVRHPIASIARIQSFALHRCLTFTSRWNIHV